MRSISVVATVSVILVYLVILAGSVVRTTGSGMGCPDWPKCFGQWIPPTDEADLPADYESIFLEQRQEKLNRYIDLIRGLGMTETADILSNDDGLLETEPFDATGTWIEYINRLLGFLAGNGLLLLFLMTWYRWKQSVSIALISTAALIAIVFQAWLGSAVVATNLTPWTITIHMSVAFLIIAMLLSVRHKAYPKPVIQSEGNSRKWLLLALILTGIQVYLGTQVRQEVDLLAHTLPRTNWIESLGINFKVHRSFSILLLIVNGLVIWPYRKALHPLHQRLIEVLLAEVLIGITLAYLGMPAYAQPVHLILATLLFGVQWQLWLRGASPAGVQTRVA